MIAPRRALRRLGSIGLAMMACACGGTNGDSMQPSTTPAPTYTITGVVTAVAGGSIPNATVYVADGAPNPNAGKTATTDNSGRYVLSGLLYTGFSLGVRANGYLDGSGPALLIENTFNTALNFVLTPLPPIQFAGIGTIGSIYVGHTESTFAVTPSLVTWSITNLGSPAPSITFPTPPLASSTGQLTITTTANRPMTFVSASLYSGAAAMPFQFIGTLRGSTAFDVQDTTARTFGSFVTVQNPNASTPIDTLIIRLTNPSLVINVPNSVGIDNIRLIY